MAVKIMPKKKVDDKELNSTRKKSLFEQKEHSLMSWVSFWRLNPHRFVSDYLGIRLYTFQKILMYLMNISPKFVFIATRGIKKGTGE